MNGTTGRAPVGEAAELIDEHEATIAQQAARIAELDTALANAVQQAQVQAQEARTQRAIVMGIGELVGCANDWEMVEAVRTRLEQQRGGVVLPERKPAPDQSIFVGRPAAYAQAFDEAKAHNRCLDEVARLNPPGECVAVPREVLYHASIGDPSLGGSAQVLIRAWKAMATIRAILAQQGKETEWCNCPGGRKSSPTAHAPNCPARPALLEQQRKEKG